MGDIHNPYTFSIIIPHKNIPTLLERCVASIPDRKDIQIIVVDDNSEQKFDAQEIKKLCINCLFNFVQIQESKGAGKARNEGLKIALGQWIFFADADDFFNPCFEDRIDYYKDSCNDIVFFKANSVDTDYYTLSDRADHLCKYIDLYNEDKKKSINMLKYYFGEPWSKMIKKSLLDQHNITFDEISIHNDTTFSLLCGHYAKNIAVDKFAVYCVTTRKDSVSYHFTDEKLLTRIDVFSKVDRFFDVNNIPLKKIKRHFISLLYFYFHNRTYYQKGVELMKNNGLSSIYIFRSLIFNFPYYIGYQNRVMSKKLLGKLNKLIQ